MPRGYNKKSLANLTPWPPGHCGNPNGNRTMGAAVKQWLNSLSSQEVTEADLRRIAKDAKAPVNKRIAARWLLQALERPDLADFESALDGQKSLIELRGDGVDTAVVKKCKTRRSVRTTSDGEKIEEVEREIELHDRALRAADLGIAHTDPAPEKQLADQVNIVLVNDGPIVFGSAPPKLPAPEGPPMLENP